MDNPERIAIKSPRLFSFILWYCTNLLWFKLAFFFQLTSKWRQKVCTKKVERFIQFISLNGCPEKKPRNDGISFYFCTNIPFLPFLLQKWPFFSSLFFRIHISNVLNRTNNEVILIFVGYFVSTMFKCVPFHLYFHGKRYIYAFKSYQSLSKIEM